MEFTYNIVRPIPFFWYKWLVLVGGLCLAVLISLLNLANNGYNLTVQYTTGPNDTVAIVPWAQKLAALDNKNAARCESQNLPTNGQYYTQNLALAYQLANIWQTQDRGNNLTLPSLRYLNNPINNCSIKLIQLNFEGQSRSAAEIGFLGWSIDALGIITCSIYNEQITNINLTVNYNYIPPTIESGTPFQLLQSPDQHNNTSLWWGQSLLSWYWLNVASAMGNETQIKSGDDQYEITKGTIAFRPWDNETDISSLNFLNPEYHFVTTKLTNDGNVVGQPLCCINPAGNPSSIGGLHAANVWPNIWIESDSFAKVFYSAIMTDLGQVSRNTVLNNGSLLTAFSKNITQMSYAETPWLKAGPARTPYNSEDTENGNLTITPVSFYTDYICQVPELKSGGSLFISLVIADIVFLQAAWTILNWIIMRYLERNRVAVYHCAGCLASSDTVGLIETPAQPGGSTAIHYQVIQ